MFLLSKASAQQPIALSWKLAGKLQTEENTHMNIGVAGPVTGINEDVLVVAGGANFPDSLPWQGGKKKYYKEIIAFRIKGGQLISIANSINLPFPIAYTANCSTSKGIVYAGGESETGISKKCFLIKWSNEKMDITGLPDLPFAITNASAVNIGNMVYLAGGELERGVSNKLYGLDLNDLSKGWMSLADLLYPVSHTILMSGNNTGKDLLYIVGGRCKQPTGVSELFDHVQVYDVKANTWANGKKLPYAVSAGTGTELKGKGLLVFGGDKGEVFHKVEMLNASLQNTMSDTDRSNLIEEKNKLLSTHPGFNKEILYYDFLRDEWVRIGKIPFKTPVTTTAISFKDYVFIPSGEIRAGVRTASILSVKISTKRK